MFLVFIGLSSFAQVIANESINYEGGSETGILQAGEWKYYNVTIPAHSEGLKVTLESDGTGGDPDLYLRLNEDPDLVGPNFKASLDKDLDVLFVDNTTDFERVYHIGVYFADASGSSNFTLKTHGAFYEAVLNWDDGSSQNGKEVLNVNLSEGDYYYKVVTSAPALDVWRTAFTITNGDAAVYLSKTNVPSEDTETGKDSVALTDPGSKGFTRPLSTAGEVWYMLIKVGSSGVVGDLVVGDVYVEDLGELAAFDSGTLSPTGVQTLPPEGARFYKSSVPSAALGWRLWLKTEDGSVTWDHKMYFRRGLLPHSSSSSYYDLVRSGQALFVPTYKAPGRGGFLEPGNGEFYYVGVFGSPNESFLLDSRQQGVTEISGFPATFDVDATDGFRYKTYKVTIPSNVIAWNASISPDSVTPLGNPNLCLRLGAVPNAFNNDAFSEAAGEGITDSITLTGDNGVYYITTYSESIYKGQLKIEEPTITEIDYATAPLDPNNPANHFYEVVNDQPNLSGWRFFQVSDPGEPQLSSLGWILELQNQVPGTKIAIRRNNVPSGATYRRDESSAVKKTDKSDASTTLGMLQHRDHESDVWYVGIYTPDAELGVFTLKSGHEFAEILDMNTGVKSGQTLAPDRWVFYRVQVPENMTDPNDPNGVAQPVLGWEVKLNSWSGDSLPEMIIRRNAIASDRAPSVGKSDDEWLTGEQWRVLNQDWTHRPVSVDGNQAVESFGATMAMGQPLEPGFYYVGVHNTSSESNLTFSFTSKAIGQGMMLEPELLNWNGGSASITDLPARHVRYFYVDIGSNVPSWRVSLENTTGESSLYLRQGWIPTSEAASNDGAGNASPFNIDYRGSQKRTNLVRLQKEGGDYYTLMPEKPHVTDPQDPALTGEYLPAGRYYLMVVSEGVLDPTNPERIGSANASSVLTSHGTATAPVPLGTLVSSTDLTRNDTYDAGQIKQYTFTVGAGVKALEVSLENRVGNPMIYGLYLLGDNGYPSGGDYGYYSGRDVTRTPYKENGGASESLIIQNNATQGQTWRLLVMDSGDENEVLQGGYQIRVKSIPTETPLTFDGNSTVTVTGIEPGTWTFYKVEIPEKKMDGDGVEQDVLGWELKVRSWSGPKLPKMLICRDSLPSGDVDALPKMDPSALKSELVWESGSQWLSYAKDWTGRPDSSDGSVEDESFGVTLAMGQPLEPGSYYVGFFNPYEYLPSEHDEDPASNYRCNVTFTSKGIGKGMQISPQELPFEMSDPVAQKAEILSLPAREVEYFYVDIPQGKKSWRVALKATAGESSLYMRQQWIPTSEVASSDGKSDGAPYCSGDPLDSNVPKKVTDLVKLQKEGDEYYVLRPKEGDVTLPEGRYYLMVVSEGVISDPKKTKWIGTGTSSAELTTHGEVNVIDHGTMPDGGLPLTAEYTYEKGNVNFHSLKIPVGVKSVEIYLEERVGNPWMYAAVASDPQAGDPLTFVHGGLYGYYSGYDVGRYGKSSDRLLTFTPSDPMKESLITLAVMDSQTGRVLQPGSYKLRVVTVTTEDLDFDGGVANVSDQSPGTWSFFKVVIPETLQDQSGADQSVLGWEIKLASWFSDGSGAKKPAVYIRRDEQPQRSGAPSLPLTSNSWETGKQLKMNLSDWTNRYKSSDGSQSYESYGSSLAMGQPLEAGTYMIGVYNEGSQPLDYALTSKAVGVGMSLAPEPLGFSAEVDVSNVPARQVRYFYVDVPEGKKSWSVSLEATSGESSLYLRQAWIPTSGASTGSPYAAPYSADYRGDPVYSNLVKLQKERSEYYTLMPIRGFDTIPSGRYFLMVVSEGQSPLNNYSIGSGESSSVLKTHGEAAIENLGVLGMGETKQHIQTYEAGEIGLVEFQVPENTQAIEVKLINRVGNPLAHLEWVNLSTENDDNLKFSKTDAYGFYSPESADKRSLVLYTIGNPKPGKYRMVISDPEKTAPSSGSYTLMITSTIPQVLHFSEAENGAGDGDTHQASGSLAEDERAFYKVEIPESCSVDSAGSPILGWRLEITSTSGNPEMRVASGALPTDIPANGSNLTAWTPYSLVVAPEEFYTGTWYVEVKGVGSLSEYTITSSPVTLERPSWQMIKPGELPLTPGVTAPYFADTGIDEDGDPLPDDQGVDLAKGGYHFYAIEIPSGNAGLLRAQLDALSGNPDLYIRREFIPTIDHKSDRALAYQFQLNDTAQTEYGNFVPKDGKKEIELSPGTWYVAVKAQGDLSARYRLKLSIGQIDDLSLDGGSVQNQALAAGDMRYYKVLVPEDPSLLWTVEYSASVGDVEMFIRDTLPPGLYQSGASLKIADWYTDRKNNEIPSTRDIESPGTYAFGHPALRPGHTYYIGIRAKVDAAFSITSSKSSDTTIGVILDLPFKGGSLGVDGLDIPRGELRYYKVDVPAHATKWVCQYEIEDSKSLEIRIEQGSLPAVDGNAHKVLTRGSRWSYNLTTYWPWVPGQTYYIAFKNTDTSDVNIKFTMEGETALTYSEWATTNGLPGDSAKADEDNNQNGIIDLLEYALHPLGSGVSSIISETITQDDGSRALRFYIPDEIRSGKAIVVQSSQDLQNWTPVASQSGMAGLGKWQSQVNVKDVDKGPYREVTVDFPDSCSVKTFMRVKVILE